MRIKYISGALGLVMIYFGPLLVVPALFSAILNEYYSILPFLLSACISFLFGYGFYKYSGHRKDFNDLKKKEALFIVTAAWLLLSMITSIPYLFYSLSPIDALFEAVSGLSTCGATIISDYSLFPKSFFFWRSMSQWVGGLGVIVMFVAILPQFAVAGRQMFFAETSGFQSDKFIPRVKDITTRLLSIYLFLTFFAALAFYLVGMSFFDSVCTAFSTVSAGGLSPNQSSIMGYKNIWINTAVTVFMFLAGINFVLQYKVIFEGKLKPVFKNSEFRYYCMIILFASVVLALILYFYNHYSSLGHCFLDSLFHVISVITSTGFASVDFNLWNTQAKAILFMLMFVGASAGSAGGGIKIIRFIYIVKYLKREVVNILHPRAIIPIKLDNIIVSKDVGRQILGFVFFYFLIFIIISLIVSIIENNAILGILGTASTLGNIGVVFEIIGPMSSFKELTIATKMLFMFTMLIGRLELIPIIAMLQLDFWRIKK